MKKYIHQMYMTYWRDTDRLKVLLGLSLLLLKILLVGAQLIKMSWQRSVYGLKSRWGSALFIFI